MMSLVKRITTIVVSASVVATLVAACSVEDATPLPRCDRGDSALIAAQSVPSAEMLPCSLHPFCELRGVVSGQHQVEAPHLH